MALSITVHGQGTFTASMEEGPVTFTAAIASVGPQGATGAAGAAGAPGVVAATAPIVYTSGTQTVSMDTTYFVRSPEIAPEDGQILAWDAGLARPDWIDNDARTLFLNGTNKTGTTIAKGKAVYISGATGNHPEITLAIATSELSSSRTIGITAEEIANNGTGKVIVAGALENVDTSAFTAGDVLYLSSSTAGGFQTTLPTQPNHGVLMGYVVRANANVGVIEVRVDNYQELGEQSDVLLTSKTNGDFLVYESATSLWKNKSAATLDLLTATTAASTYLTQSNAASTYLSQTSAASDYLSKAGNLSGLASASTARTNLGLGTMATETAANYALLASPALTGTPTAPTAAAATNTTQIATTAFVQTELTGQRVDVQTFGTSSTSGSFTWTKPANAKMVVVRMVGGGGGGASGAVGTTSQTRAGGAGGSGGSHGHIILPASEISTSTVAITVGAGGTGGTAVNSGSGQNGQGGGFSAFGNYRTSGGNTASSVTTGGAGVAGNLMNLASTTISGAGGNGGATGGGNATAITSGLFMSTGGGGGAGQAAGTTTSVAGGNGASRTNTTTPAGYNATLAGGSGGTVGGTNPTAGTDGDATFAGGTGGGGGAYRTAVTGQTGGKGGWPGGGGGGGSAADNGYTSGAGGDGGNGEVIVITYF